MHIIQKELMSLAGRKDISKMTLREVSIEIGMPHVSPSLLKYHFKRLEKKQLLFVDKTRRKQIREAAGRSDFLSIPIMGSANCGPASIFTSEYPERYIKISKNILESAEGLIGVVASGYSMNNASVRTARIGTKGPINDGDIVLVDTRDRSTKDGYVLFITDGMANIKKLVKRQYDIALLSESNDREAYPPIIITPEDNSLINGRVVMVIEQ